MPSLNFGTGLKTFDMNGDSDKTVSFCPTDFNFIQRLYRAFEALEKLQGDYIGRASANLTTEEMIELISSTDKEVRGIIDAAFEAPVSDMAFGKLSSFAIADGVPLWGGFLLAVMSECDDGFVAQTAATNPRLQKMLGKYKK